tara:strand:- start:2693 stop:2872 length:180 start_codon:yes stop_codon:yes gene_type:complete
MLSIRHRPSWGQGSLNALVLKAGSKYGTEFEFWVNPYRRHHKRMDYSEVLHRKVDNVGF